MFNTSCADKGIFGTDYISGEDRAQFISSHEFDCSNLRFFPGMNLNILECISVDELSHCNIYF